MQVLVQEKKVHFQQNVLTLKGWQYQTHITSIFSTEAVDSPYVFDFSVKNVP